ncbi:MAG TPA: preprotein translocase subunit SecA [Phycisphaerae bacterium]|nr:preprotein translocase subunit SecA [Phycisphaerae bacterium]
MLKLVRFLFLKAIGGSRNERIVRARMRFVTERINPLEPQMRALGDGEIRAKTAELRRRLAEGESRQDILAEAFALVREASRRGRDHRQFDVQLAAGMVLDEGKIAEEATGEGKTIACYPAICMAALEGKKSHVITVNDYLVQRDAEFARPIFELLGMTVGYITAGMSPDERHPQYACDVTYGTNSEFGFDFLRDNMKLAKADQVQGPLDFAIIDEVDSILIDEARTPLIISGPAHGSTERFRKADAVAGELVGRNRAWDQANRRVESLKRQIKSLDGELSRARGAEADKVQARFDRAQAELDDAEAGRDSLTKHFEVELDKKSVHMTHEGVTVAQEIAGIGSFYVGSNMEWPHLMEQALRAHLVYEKDKDFVVQQGRVIIVDEFTGRLLEGREWSDGLHQAVEAKEHVPIKQENQTMATITYQNFFKLYKKLAGMTGTAMTEAAEFMKIYKLDVVSVPTHRPVNRMDYEDRIYGDGDAKYDALVEEINNVSKAGRPILVGTTSIEKSEKISEMLTRRHGVEHQVLNARPENAAREADIVMAAGQQRPLKKGAKQMVGNVTIATNMAGRGTDIKLGPGVVSEKCKVPSAERLAELGVEAEDLFPSGTTKCCLYCPQHDALANCAHCFKPKLDAEFPSRGRTQCRAEVPCGVHIVGTERHEARRIDNQLRGRSGRQGDPGSSRFFLSLRDELLAIFAGEWTLKVLGWLGLQGDTAIEDRRVSKGIERAQKKVEERNFEIRKNLLEYDEVMDLQRRAFYSQRQQILEGRDIETLVMSMLGQSIADAVESYIDGKYAQRCIAEWARQRLQISVSEDQIRAETAADLPDLEANLRARAKDEAGNVISMTLGEYMDSEADQREWDLRGLSGWAMSRFNVNLSQNQLRRMAPDQVEQELTAAAAAKIDEIDMSPLVRFLEEGFARRVVAEWARDKFGIEATSEELAGDSAAIAEMLTEKVRRAYARREIEYPVEYALERTVGQAGTDNAYAVGALVAWANRKYEAGLSPEDIQDTKVEDIHSRLLSLSEQWMAGDRLGQAIRTGVGSSPDVPAAVEFARERFDTELKPEDFDGDVPGKLRQIGRQFLRREMTELERFVLLQIYDGSWVDHLLAMDHLRSGIGLRGFAERDPKVAFKLEGTKLFEEMMVGVRERVTGMVFKVRLRAGEEMTSAYRVSEMVHEQLSGYDHLTQGMDMAAASQPQKVATIIREKPRVGRNDPCPCGSGKKFKKCCGKNV